MDHWGPKNFTKWEVPVLGNNFIINWPMVLSVDYLSSNRSFFKTFLQTLRMGPSLMASNPTWPSRNNQTNQGNSENNSSNMVQSMSTTNSFFGTPGVRTSVSMVSSDSTGCGVSKSGSGGWPVRLL